MEIILRGKELWKIVCGEETLEGFTDITARQAFEAKWDRALSLIVLSIEDICNGSVIHLQEPRDVWEELKTQHQSVFRASTYALYSCYLRIQQSEQETISSYVNNLQTIENKFSAIGENLTEPQRLRTLLRGLREELETTGKIILVTEKSIQDAVAQLIVKEANLQDELKTCENHSEANKALSTLSSIPVGNCDHCGRPGHSKDKCFYNPHGSKYRRRTFRAQQAQNLRTNKTTDDSRYDENRGTFSSFIAVCLRTRSKISKNSEMRRIIDSGAADHMCSDVRSFKALRTVPEGMTVSVRDGKTVQIKSIGTITGRISGKNEDSGLQLLNVLHVPNLVCNLLSVSRIRKAGFNVQFRTTGSNKGVCVVTNAGQIVLEAFETSNGLFETTLSLDRSTAMKGGQNSGTTWHRRLCHVSNEILQKSLPLVDETAVECIHPSFCKDCNIKKLTRRSRKSYPEGTARSNRPLELVYTELVGPLKCPSLGNSPYFITLYDDYSAFSAVRFLKQKSDTGHVLKCMIQEVENIKRCNIDQLRVTYLRSDNRREHLSKPLQEWLASKGIVHQFWPPYSPESNGCAEHLDRTILQVARAILHNLPDELAPLKSRLRAEAVTTANYTRNRLFTTASKLNNKTPFQIITGIRPNLVYMRRFGSHAYVHLPKQTRIGKLAQRAQKGFMIGDEYGVGYRILCEDLKTVRTSRDVKVVKTDEKESKDSKRNPHSDPFIPFMDEHNETTVQEDAGSESGSDIQQEEVSQKDSDVPATKEEIQLTEELRGTLTHKHFPDVQLAKRKHLKDLE